MKIGKSFPLGEECRVSPVAGVERRVDGRGGSEEKGRRVVVVVGVLRGGGGE